MTIMTPIDPEQSVKTCYSTWGTSYYDDYYTDKAPYPPVHRDLIRSELQKHAPKSLLDAGCGPASILRDLGDLGIDLYGFDLTPEMIAECKRVMTERGHPVERFWQGSVTNREHFRAPTGGPSVFDAAICVGVLPHIPAEQDSVVFKNLRESVRPGAMVMVEARNMLFSLFTLNRYSQQFFADELLPLAALREIAGEAKTESVLDGVKARFRMDVPPVRKGKEGEPGYDEVLSRTHNPLVAREQFAAAGFRDVEVLFYHFHAFPPMLQDEAPDAFRRLSVQMESNPRDWRGYFMASAFFLKGIAA